MTNEQKQVREFMIRAGQKCPAKPTIPDLKTRKLRAKLMLEEVLETINKGLGLSVDVDFICPSDILIEDVEFVERGNYDPIELVDGLGDLHYVAYCGTALACGIDMEPIFEEIHKSNMSKFIDGYKDKHGKWIKGPSFTPPNIKEIINKQIGQV